MYNDASDKDESSFGEMSSIDENDLKLILDGDHETKFEAIEFIKHFVKYKMSKSMRTI